MDKTSELVIRDNATCEALECHRPATESISLSAGKYGIIPLQVCMECLKLFNDGNEDKNHSDHTGSLATV